MGAMLRSLLVWGGPVMEANLDGIAWPLNTDIVTFSRGPDGGIGSSSFDLLGKSYLRSDGHILPHLLASRDIDIDDYDQIAISGFSAFHGLGNLLLHHDADRINAAVPLDACFSAYGSLAKKGYVAFAKMAARGERLFVMTASWGGGGAYSTGFECVWAQVKGALGSEDALGPITDLPQGVPEPDLGGQTEGLVVLDYREHKDITHGDHVHKLARPVLQGYLVPYLANGTIVGATGGANHDGGWSTGAKVAAMVGGAVALTAAVFGYQHLARQRASKREVEE